MPGTQLYDLREMAKQRGYEIVREYSDVISGAKSKPPGLDQLMADARRRRFDVVLVAAFDRVARCALEVLDELNHLRIEFVSFWEKHRHRRPTWPEGEREFIGDRQVAVVVRSIREEYDFPIFLNADHTHSLRGALETAKAGYDWIVFDTSTQPFEQNVGQTKEAVVALKGARPDILVEGEIGNIGSGSEIHDLADLTLTTPLEAAQFVAETSVDTLAPAVGNMHGMSRTMAAGETRKRLDIERIRAIQVATRIL